jgi:fucose 4-O-acetylase-like acetyltransferase
MVAGHVVGNVPTASMRVSDDSPWRLIFSLLQDTRMPLFTVLSGYLYSVRPRIRSASGYRRLARGKVRRLLVPLFSIGTLLFVIRLLLPVANANPSLDEWWITYVYGVDFLWFLQAIFLLFLVVGALDLARALDRSGPWLAITVAAALLFVAVDIPKAANVFSIEGAIRLLPFFLLGLGIARFRFADTPGRATFLVAAVWACAYAIRIATMTGNGEPHDALTRCLALVVGMSSVLLLFWLRARVATRPLAWLGGFAFTIYLLHYFAVQATRLVVQGLGLDANWFVFATGLLAGVSLPIAFDLTAGRDPRVRALLLGEKPLPGRGVQENRPALG